MSNHRFARLFLLVVFAVTMATAAAQAPWRQVYRQGFGENAHPLYVMQGVIPFGPQQDTPFVARLLGMGLEIANDRNSSVIRYYFLEPRHVIEWQEAANSAVAVAVDVGGDFGEFPGAGLVYRLDPATRHFYAFVLTGGNGFGVFKLDGSGYNEVLRDTSDFIQPGQLNRLSITPEGAIMHLFINGEYLGSYEDAAIRGTGVGIIVAGTGRFEFDEFVIHVSP